MPFLPSETKNDLYHSFQTVVAYILDDADYTLSAQKVHLQPHTGQAYYIPNRLKCCSYKISFKIIMKRAFESLLGKLFLRKKIQAALIFSCYYGYHGVLISIPPTYLFFLELFLNWCDKRPPSKLIINLLEHSLNADLEILVVCHFYYQKPTFTFTVG